MVQETGNNPIDFSKTKNYILSIRLSTDGFSFCIYDPNRNETVSTCKQKLNATISLTANLKQVFNEVNFLNHHYKHVYVVVSNERFTQIPNELFEAKDVEQLFYYNHPQIKNETILFNSSSQTQVTTLFAIDKSSFQLIKTYFPEASFHAETHLFNEYFIDNERNWNKNRMCVNYKKDSIDVFCYDNNTLLLINSFDVKQKEDGIFYLLGIWKQLNFDQEKDELLIKGEVSEEEFFIEELKKYILEIKIDSKETNVELQTLLKYENNKWNI